MALYRFRVAFEDYDDTIREIEIKTAQTFEDFHKAIQAFIDFDDSKPASFYMSDDNWKKGKEITNRELKESEKDRVIAMSNARLRDFIADPHQKLYYIFDFSAMWAFRIELVKILVKEEPGITYPYLAKSIGLAPKQYGNIMSGPIPQPDDFEGGILDEEIDGQETGMLETEELVEAEDVPIAVETEEGIVSDLEESDDDINEEEKPDNDEF